MKTIVYVAAALASLQAGASNIAPDTLMCEGPEPFAVIAADGWTSKGGAAQMNTARMSVQAAKLSGQVASIHRGLATTEETIRADSSRRLAFGSTTSRALAADADAKSAATSVSTYEGIVATCAASGPAALATEVLEQRPISGLAKVRLQFKGAAAELWVRRSDLSE